MSVLSRQKDGSATIVRNTQSLSGEGADNKARGRIVAPRLQDSPLLAQVREEKVLGIQQQLAKGTYDLDERLDAALDSLFEDLTT